MTTKEELETLRQKFDNVGTKLRGLIDDYNLQKLSIERLTDRNNEIEEDLNNLAYEIEQGEPREQYGRWKPKEGETFYFITAAGGISDIFQDDTPICQKLWALGNCYQSREQAKQALERIKIRTWLQDIALRLNRGRKIDWNDDMQEKYYLLYDHDEEILTQDYKTISQSDDIYCLEPYLETARAEIGEERLVKYFMGE